MTYPWSPGDILTASDLNSEFGSKLDLAGGKILQIVRATDSTDRSTTSASYVDASISVTISPQKNDSAVLIIWSFAGDTGAVDRAIQAQITDSSNNAISGAERAHALTPSSRLQFTTTFLGYSTPATTSATTYKGRFRNNSAAGSVTITNSTHTGQLYAIEVSA